MTSYRDLFSIPSDFHYLNCAFMAPMSNSVYASAVNALERRRLPAGYGVADFFEPADHARELFSKILGSNDPRRIALIPSSSYGLAIVARNVLADESSSVVQLEEQFPSSVNTWRRYTQSNNCQLRIVERPSPGLVNWDEQIVSSIDESTVIACLPHVHWADGTVFDLKLISERCRRVGAKLIVDGTQSIGALDLDFNGIQPDAVICAGYKWLTGNMGLGAMYLGPAFDNAIPLEENWIARANSRRFSNLTEYTDEYAEGAVRFDVGERGISLLLPIFVAALTQVADWGTARIQEHCRRITARAIDELRDHGFGVPGNSQPKHLFGVRLPAGSDTRQVHRNLKQHNISVSLRGEFIRVSPHLYNDERDVQALVDALRQLSTIPVR